MTSRGSFLAAASMFTASVRAAADIEAKIAKKDSIGISKQDADKGISLGDRDEVYPLNLDTNVNEARAALIVNLWPMMGRAGAERR